MAALKWNEWQRSTGIGGSFGPEYADNVIVESNVIINNEFLRSDPNTGNAIKFIKTGGNFTARNNTILSLLKTGINGIVTNSSTGTVRAYNNIIQGFALGLDLQSSSMVENYNCLFNNTNNSLKSLGANSLLVDPRLDENYMPQNPLVHMMGLQYDAGNAATTGAQFDIYGTAFGKSIGAIQADAIDFDEIAGALYWSVNGVKY